MVFWEVFVRMEAEYMFKERQAYERLHLFFQNPNVAESFSDQPLIWSNICITNLIEYVLASIMVNSMFIVLHTFDAFHNMG